MEGDKIINPMLAKDYQGQDIRGWMISEKLDGVRGIWTGSRLVSRNGKPFHPPAWFINQLPLGEPLDGELYIGRGMFQRTAAIIRKKTPVDSEWKQIRYRVFDAPDCPGGFETRIAYAENVLWVKMCSGVASVIPHWKCSSTGYLKALVVRFTTEGAEGVVLRQPGSPYESGKSNHLLRYKVRQDSEARVIAYQEGTGKYAGRVGALKCQWRDGIVVKLGTGLSDEMRTNPPRIGSMVTFSYRGFTDRGAPREAAFKAVRDYE